MDGGGQDSPTPTGQQDAGDLVEVGVQRRDGVGGVPDAHTGGA